MNRILKQCEFIPKPWLPIYREVAAQTICEDDLTRENICVSFKKFKFNYFRLLIILPSNEKNSSECFTLDIETGVFYACRPIQFDECKKVLYGFVLGVFINDKFALAYPNEITICDLFAADGSVFDSTSVSERIFFLKKIRDQDRLPLFRFVIPEQCSQTSVEELVRFEVVNPKVSRMLEKLILHIVKSN
jgi:hypothetical protein